MQERWHHALSAPKYHIHLRIYANENSTFVTSHPLVSEDGKKIRGNLHTAHMKALQNFLQLSLSPENCWHRSGILHFYSNGRAKNGIRGGRKRKIWRMTLKRDREGRVYWKKTHDEAARERARSSRKIKHRRHQPFESGKGGEITFKMEIFRWVRRGQGVEYQKRFHVLSYCIYKTMAVHSVAL